MIAGPDVKKETFRHSIFRST